MALFVGEMTDALRSAHAVPGVPGLYLQHQHRHPNDRHDRLLFSATMFLFPGRAMGPYGREYGEMVRKYLLGLTTSVENMRHFPGWKYRLYLDRSACVVAAGFEELARLAGAVTAAVDALLRKHPLHFEVVAVRYERDGYAEGATFLPAAWRFLPLLDAEDVDAFCCWDADSPPHPLHVQRVERWMGLRQAQAQDGAGSARKTNKHQHQHQHQHQPRRTDAQLIFFPTPMSRTAWCSMAVASSMQTEGAREAREHAMCPWAQLWAARRIPGSALFSGRTVARKIDLTHGTATQQLLASITPEVVARLATATSVKDRGSDSDFRMLVSDTRAAVAADSASAPWARAIASDDRAAAIAAALVHGSKGAAATLADRLKRRYGFRVASLLDQTFRRKMPESLRTLTAVAVESDYGVDEWVQHLLMCAVGHAEGAVEFVQHQTPEAGVDSAFRYVPRSSALDDKVVGARIAALAKGSAAAVAVDRDQDVQYTVNALSDLLWRTGAVLALLRVDDEESEASRLFRTMRDAHLARVASTLRIAGASLAFLTDDAGCRLALRRLASKTGAFVVTRPRALADFCRVESYDPERDPPFDFGGSAAAFSAASDVVVRALLLCTNGMYKVVRMGEVGGPWWMVPKRNEGENPLVGHTINRRSSMAARRRP